MDKDRKGLAIIFHSGSYDRISHGLSIALTALALGREVRLFFSYWALEYLNGTVQVVVDLPDDHQFASTIKEDINEKIEPLWDVEKVNVAFTE